MNPQRRRTQAGFTLIEILLVVVIIGLLLSIAAVKFAGRQKEAAAVKARADVESCGTALKLYEMDNYTYPTTEQGLEALWIQPTTPPAPKNWKKYLERPLSKDPWGNPYMYKSPGTHNPDSYDMFSMGPDGAEGGGDDITNWD